MKIQWYPGHMHKAQKEIRQVLSGIDVAIEVLDARIPFSSQNPLLADILKSRPRLRLLNKADLADPAQTRIWEDWLSRDADTRVLVTSAGDDKVWRELPGICQALASRKRDIQSATRPVHALITGIPNVGKSTIINRLAGRTVARTGNEPAVTKAQQRIDIGHGVILRDTPGVLWPNLENRSSGYRLAITGAIRDTAIDSADVAAFAIEFLLEYFADRLTSRYTLSELTTTDPIEVLEQIGQQRGCLTDGAQVDFDRVARLLLTDIRSGELGPLTFETPEQMLSETTAMLREREQTEAARNERKQSRRRERRKR
ncbi:MAG: ribosome biogenesis GTPase YlqF [Gammaproteobacteria bacterium]|nr:ribosome biogenesis GTPase YlqF [Gammaproteobacteria bacterium]